MSMCIEKKIEIDITDRDTWGLSGIFIQGLSKSEGVDLTFRYALTKTKVLNWETTFVDRILYIKLPEGSLPTESKDAFVSLLEYAEDVLGALLAIICFSKDREQHDFFVRAFMFMGLQRISAENPMLHTPDSTKTYMVYQIEQTM